MATEPLQTFKHQKQEIEKQIQACNKKRKYDWETEIFKCAPFRMFYVLQQQIHLVPYQAALRAHYMESIIVIRSDHELFPPCRTMDDDRTIANRLYLIPFTYREFCSLPNELAIFYGYQYPPNMYRSNNMAPPRGGPTGWTRHLRAPEEPEFAMKGELDIEKRWWNRFQCENQSCRKKYHLTANNELDRKGVVTFANVSAFMDVYNIFPSIQGTDLQSIILDYFQCDNCK